jgi:predicted heme/steroid binding protein
MLERKFTREELGCYNGNDGVPIFVAYEGIVYDLSGSFLWRGGRHQVLHWAGKDLTEEIHLAPHDATMLYKFPIVGIYKK